VEPAAVGQCALAKNLDSAVQDLLTAINTEQQRLEEVAQSSLVLDHKLTALEHAIERLQSDVAQGVVGLLVQLGKSPEQADAYVRRTFHIPPRREA
ncbi:MAG: hypothetical protein KDA99_09320, partial [Planctomycetales bacterium]|nr:hypothetical protein [Planctomycetales bacterium]